MNEFGAIKLGEVLAFEKLGKFTFERGKNSLLSLFSVNVIADFVMNYDEFIINIKRIAEGHNVTEITLPKSEKTLDKLKKMQDLYIGDEWDNAIEICEWSGFYEGASIVHWELVLGVALKNKDKDLESLSLKALRFHNESFRMFSDKLRANGSIKSG
jgi:hypothetical protein